jgi:hypothetical protein
MAVAFEGVESAQRMTAKPKTAHSMAGSEFRLPRPPCERAARVSVGCLRRAAVGVARASILATQGEADVDLLLMLKGKRIGEEIKYAEAPSGKVPAHCARGPAAGLRIHRSCAHPILAAGFSWGAAGFFGRLSALLSRRASELPHPQAEGAQDEKRHRTWPERHRVAGDEHLGVNNQPDKLRDGH